jgi:hypothetical protein
MKTYIELINNSKLINMVQENDNGTRKEKLITIEDFVSSVTSSLDGKKKFVEIKSPLFRELKGCKLIQYKTVGPKATNYVLLGKKHRTPMLLFNRFYDNVGIPNLLYCVHVVNNRLSKINVVAVKNENINADTQLYFYPFTNVSSDTMACIGRNTFSPGIEDNDCKELYNVPNQFMSMPNNLDYYKATNNTKCYECEELIKYLIDKDFDDSLLVENDLTYSEWFDKL